MGPRSILKSTAFFMLVLGWPAGASGQGGEFDAGVPAIHKSEVVYTAPSRRLPWGAAELGLEAQFLRWNGQGQWTWGLQGAFGIRIVDELFVKARISLPMFVLLAILGDQLSAGLEVEYWFLPDEGGFSLALAGGAGYTFYWNQHATAIGPESPQPDLCGSGLRSWALVRLGLGGRKVSGNLDLGIDIRVMDLKNQYGRSEGQLFIGPYAGLSVSVRFF